MAQEFPHYCPRCGAEVAPGQRVCARCGLDFASYLPDYQPAQWAGPPSTPQQPSLPVQGPQSPLTPQQQPPQWSALPSSAQQQPAQWAASPASVQQPSQWPALPSTPQSPQMAQQSQAPQFTPRPTFSPAQPSQRRGNKRLGLVLVLVLILFLLGAAGYLGWSALSNSIQPTITTSTLNSTLPYAGIDVTVLNVQQSQRFLDDPRSATDGMLRVHFQAQNKVTVPVNLAYSHIAYLVLPGGKVEAPTYVKSDVSVAPGATQTSAVDFAVPQTMKIDQLTLRLGAANEAQVDLPLTGHDDTAQYAPKTVNINKKVPGEYLGLDWSLVSAISQLSVPGQQASKGMRYVIVTLKVDNTLTQTAIAGSPYDYIRLKAGDVTATPTDTTLPVSFDATTNGKTGTVTFLVPQNATTLTFMLVPQNQGGFDQASLNFQI